MQRSTGVNQGSNAQEWPMVTKFGRKTPDQSEVQWCGQRLYRGSDEVNQGLNCSEMPYGYQLWQDEPLTEVQ